jgi:D-sedoheptulose 7-phosphate isomerase
MENSALKTEMEKFVDIRISQIRELALNEASIPKNRIVDLSRLLIETFESGNKLALIGNGGSAAEAIHIAAEFTGKCVVDHKPLPVMCLNESQSSITAIANDYGLEHIFSRQVLAHLKKGDVLIALSTSGRSPNILRGMEAAVQIGVKVLLWTGGSHISMESVDVWNVPSNSTPRVQEIHLSWGHIIAETVESFIIES